MDHLITTEHGGFVVPPCPSWCEQSSDHNFEPSAFREWDGTLVRQHRAASAEVSTIDGSSTVSVDVYQCETVGDPDAEDEAPVVYAAEQAFSAAQARVFAAALLAAADVLDTIESK